MAESGVVRDFFSSSLVVWPLSRYVYLQEGQTIYFRSHKDVVYVAVKFPFCSALEMLDLRMRNIARENVPVVDFFGKTWNKMHYIYDKNHNVINFIVTGNSTSNLMMKKWNLPKEYKYVHLRDLRLDFPSSTRIGRNCFNPRNGTLFTWNRGSVSRVNSDAAFFNRSSTNQLFNSKNNVQLRRLPTLPDFSYKNVKSFSYSSHIAYLPVGLILFMMTVCIRMCIGRSQKPIMQRVRASTVVRLPVGSCSTSATPGKENPPPPTSDSPPTYDDIEKADAPPPSYAEILKDYILPKETTTGSQQETLVQIEMAVADSVKEPTDATAAASAEHETSLMKSEVTTAKSNNVKTQSSFRSLKEEK